MTRRGTLVRVAHARRTAPLLLLDPELGRGLAPDEHALALREAFVPFVDLEGGAWSPAGIAGRGGDPFALLVVAGILVREVVIGDVVTNELVGPCDLIEPAVAPHEMIPVVVRWTVAEDARIAILDLRMRLFLQSLGRLIGARRPTVSLALRELADAGALSRRDDGTWLLRFDAAQAVGTQPHTPGDDADRDATTTT